MKHVVGFSGGIDSQACARWVLNRFPAKDVILLNSDAGGNEHPLTTEFIAEYGAKVHPVTQANAIVADMGGRAPGKIAEVGLQPDDTLTFDLLAVLKQRFPSRRAQFCTEHLKLAPQRRWLHEHLPDGEYTRYTGVRRDESSNRSDTSARCWDDYFDCPQENPLCDWTKQMCFDYVLAHREPINPLYSLGFTRVGCAPCINSGKDDILRWAQRFPAMIDKVRAWEQRVGRMFFAPCVPGMAINCIDDVVAWAGTVHGGKQIGLHVLHERPVCVNRSHGMTNIEWTDATWNPVTGCTRGSAGVACFVKHLGARPVDWAGRPIRLRDAKGGDPEEWPSHLRVREWPVEATP